MSMIEESRKINDLCNLIRAEYAKMETPFGKKSFIKTLNQLAAEQTDQLFKEMTKAVSSGYLLTGKAEKPSTKKPVAKTKKNEPILEGFWRPAKKNLKFYKNGDPILDYPDVTKLQGNRSFTGKRAFLNALSIVESKAGQKHYKGWSTCRICNKRCGSTEFVKNAKWPAGYSHYISEHNVKPTKAFADMIFKAAGVTTGTTVSTR